MEFYTTPAFFVLLGISIVPAAILGLCERRVKYYGFAVSWVFILLLFSKDLYGFLSFLVFVGISILSFKVVLSSWQTGQCSIAKYRICLALTMLPLVICKVAAVFDSNILGFLGISYLTFRSLQVLIEIRDNLIKDMGVFGFLYFVTFFATFTSGPIDRSRRFENDVNRVMSRHEYADMLSKGLFFILFGAVYYFVIAAVIQPHFTPGPFDPSLSLAHNLAAAVKDAYCYGGYLFFNFAGYSLMAMGVSYCFGIATPANFKAPFAALDMKDFWNRWHITLSFWLRDFVFMRFTRFAMKKRLFSSRLQTACCAYMVNMIIMGAWHGLTIDYLAYGVYQGLALALTDVFQKKSRLYKNNKNKTWFKVVSWFVTLNIIMLGFALFSGQVHTIVGGMIHG
ncbi:MAG: D-alanyl-lipoteichoic acid biosynthesis protein DltB [Exiguobacterium sp.]|nr:D-alanyl-lipoteichoic acid biosynthesis protein DltB [Exiguobacterium sp.]